MYSEKSQDKIYEMETKFMKNSRNKIIAGVVSACVVLIAVMVILNGNQENTIAPIGLPNEEATAAQTTTTIPATAESRAATKSPDTQPPVTRSQTQETQIQVTRTPDTEPPVNEITLAPVEIPSERVAEILEQNDVQYVPSTNAVQTAPPPGMPEGAQGIDGNGRYYKIENGQRYVWNNALGWVRSSGDSHVIIMDVEDFGDRPQYEGGW
jgi:hypothetical protein